jgi:CubicO group peptidase (beta-lactamase class C family)
VAFAVVMAGCSDDGGGAAAPADTSAPTESGISADRVAGSFGELDSIVQGAMDDTGVPGVAVAVVSGDEVVYTQGYGVADTSTGEPVTPETVFQIASLSKPVSSTIMAGLAGDGAFDWDDPIAEYAPDLTLSDPWVTEHVTFADLFSHRSGIPGATGGNDLESIGFDRDTIMERMRLLPLDPFRATYSYSNFGMTMGGEAAATAAGTTWEDAADDVLFGPAGMTSTSMRHDDFVAADNAAQEHIRLDGEWVPEVERQPDPQAPAGGVSSNVVDLGRWMRLQLAGGSLDGDQIVETEALDSTHTPHIVNRPPSPEISDPAGLYGLGWNIGVDATGVTRWNHSGAFSTGAATVAVALPAADVGIVVLTNAQPIGVPESIADAYLQYLETGEVTEDWVAVWGERMGGLLGEDQDWTPPADAAPARPDAAYVGTYANDYVGEAAVEAAPDGTLTLMLGPDDDRRAFPLEHYTGDTFSYVHFPELPMQRETVEFVVAGDVASAITLSAFDESGLGTLQRG